MPTVMFTRSQALALKALIARVDDVNTAQVKSGGGYGDIEVEIYAPSQTLKMRVTMKGTCQTIYEEATA